MEEALNDREKLKFMIGTTNKRSVAEYFYQRMFLNTAIITFSSLFKVHFYQPITTTHTLFFNNDLMQLYSNVKDIKTYFILPKTSRVPLR